MNRTAKKYQDLFDLQLVELDSLTGFNEKLERNRNASARSKIENKILRLKMSIKLRSTELREIDEKIFRSASMTIKEAQEEIANRKPITVHD